MSSKEQWEYERAIESRIPAREHTIAMLEYMEGGKCISEPLSQPLTIDKPETNCRALEEIPGMITPMRRYLRVWSSLG